MRLKRKIKNLIAIHFRNFFLFLWSDIWREGDSNGVPTSCCTVRWAGAEWVHGSWAVAPHGRESTQLTVGRGSDGAQQGCRCIHAAARALTFLLFSPAFQICVVTMDLAMSDKCLSHSVQSNTGNLLSNMQTCNLFMKVGKLRTVTLSIWLWTTEKGCTNTGG